MKNANFTKVTENQAIEMFLNINKSTKVAITYFVDESNSRTIKGKKALQKRVTLVADLNHDYKRNIERRIGEEFIPQEMKGKTKVGNNVVQNDKGEKMLYASVYQYSYKVVTYFYNGKPITKEQAIQMDLFAPSYFTPKKTVGRGLVSEEDNFFPISPKFANIEQFKVNKQKYLIVK